MNRIELDAATFRSYLEKHHLRAFKTATKCNCPIASWMQEELGYVSVAVSSCYVRIFNNKHQAFDEGIDHLLPSWACTFIQGFDGPYGTRPETRMGIEAKAILDGIPYLWERTA